MRKFVLASFNRDKVRELRELLRQPWMVLVGMNEIEGASAPAETGKTLLENAFIKARAAVRLTRLPAIADDTGLEVDALGGAPGVESARFAGRGASYEDNLNLLLERLKSVPPEQRTARFRTVCVACFPDEPDCTAEGVLEGRIATAPRGAVGFGYDPVFEVQGLGRTLAELTPEEKNRCSHRARAVHALAAQLIDW